jgi:thymidylate synthase
LYTTFRRTGCSCISRYGGYGPRIFGQRGNNQLENVIALLREHPVSRRAVIQLFNAEDLGVPRHPDIPCTCTLQFLMRDNKLHLITTMRSNDAYMGLPHDIFCFTMLQEALARTLGVELGSYQQFVGNLHLYERDAVKAQQYIDEGFQSTLPMPAMPSGDPWPSIKALLDVEARIRGGEKIDAKACGVSEYWADLIRLLQIFAATGDHRKIETLKAKMVFGGYAPYIEARKRRSPAKQNQSPVTVAPVAVIAKGS